MTYTSLAATSTPGGDSAGVESRFGILASVKSIQVFLEPKHSIGSSQDVQAGPHGFSFFFMCAYAHATRTALI